jgi:hypothetical protein
MKKILLLLVSGLLIACMAGAVLADPVNDETLINAPNGQIVATPGQPTPVTINLFPYAPGGINVNSYHEVMLQLDVTKPVITVDLPAKDWAGNSAHWLNKNNQAISTLTSTNNVAYLANQKFTTTSKIVATVHTSATTSAGSLTVNIDRDADCQHVYIATDTDPITSVPEFPTVAVPVAGVLGILFVFGRKKEEI